MKRILILLLCAGCATTTKVKEVEIETESTLNSVTRQDTGIVNISLAPWAVETAPVQITWMEPVDSLPPPMDVRAIEVTSDSVSIITPEAKTSFRTPVKGEKLQVRQVDKPTPKGFLSGEPLAQKVEVEVTERSMIQQIIDGAEVIGNVLLKVLIGLAIVGVVGLGVIITIQIIKGRERKALVKGTADVLKEMVKGITNRNKLIK